MEYLSRYTRFRAYQLGNEGSSFSYFDGTRFTLIEARITEKNASSIVNELKLCNNKERIDCLHITSWDTDHCSKGDLEEIIKYLKPDRIEYPGYSPHTDSGKECLAIVRKHNNPVKIDPSYVHSLNPANNWTYRDVLYDNRKNHEEPNNNSSVRFFRSGSFTVLSLGDLENVEIANYLIGTGSIINNEVDVMILAHHGADNGFTSQKFIQAISPKVAICTSNYDNQYEHPKQEIRDLLYENEVTLYTTKTGDVVIESTDLHKTNYRSINLITNSTEVSSVKEFTTKRYDTWR